MLTLVRAGLAAALIALALVPAAGQDAAKERAFQSAPLDEAAVKLEAQIKTDAGKVTKPAAQLRKDADLAFQKNDYRAGMLVLGQLVSVAPDDGANWLRLARTIRQIKPRDDKEKALLLDRAATSAYIGYLRAKDRTVEADSLTLLGDTLAEQHLWRPALDALRIALEQRESADLRGRYERLRLAHGFRMLDYSIDSDAASPRACFQFSETLPGKGTDFSPFVAVLGQDRPAIVGQRQAALRRGPEARRALSDHLARRPAVDRARDAAEVGRVHDLRARPQAVRALLRQGLCAAAHRPARHSGAERQHLGGDDRGLPHRRPQPHRHRARLRFPAQSVALSGRADRRRTRLESVERRAQGRAQAQHRGDDRLPGRRGAQGHRPRRLRDDRDAEGRAGRQRLRRAGDAVVHRLRSRPHRLHGA